MSKEIRGNQRHMTLDDRIYIEQALEKAMTFKEIAKFLKKDPTTISKEIKKHRTLKPRNSYGSLNTCKSRQSCRLSNVCKRTVTCKKRCASCSDCNKNCDSYIKDECTKINHAPYVCNGCEKKVQCRYDKYFYRSTTAYKRYRLLISSSREGINITEENLSELDSLISPLILKGQPIAHIYVKHASEIPCGIRTIYNYIDNNVLGVKNLDLLRKVKYKLRKQAKKSHKDPSLREGRKYTDFTAYLEKFPDTQVVEMDTVEGVKGGKVLLTMLFRNSKCMLAFLLPSKTQEAVLEVFNRLEESISTFVFRKTFQLILTDNGSEFLNPILLETGKDSIIRTSIYYCDANASYQKGALEKNHEFIRYIVPKGESFDDYTQEDITLMINHINSTARGILNGLPPYELASLLLDEYVIEKLGLKRIAHDNVFLKPSLLKKNNK